MLFKFRIFKFFEAREKRKMRKLQKSIEQQFESTLQIHVESHEKSLATVIQRGEVQKQELLSQFNREKDELLQRLTERDKFIEQLRKEHEDKQKMLLKRFEVLDEKRVQQLTLLQERLNYEIEAGRSYHIYWEQKSHVLKGILFEIESRLRSRTLLSNEIIRRISTLEEDADQFHQLQEKLAKHQNRVLKENRTIESVVVEIPTLEQLTVNPNEIN